MSITNLELTVREVDGVTLVCCPHCNSTLFVKSDLQALSAKQFSLTSDQCSYTIHCLQKQEVKLQHALKQVHETITTLEILRELAKEKEL